MSPHTYITFLSKPTKKNMKKKKEVLFDWNKKKLIIMALPKN